MLIELSYFKNAAKFLKPWQRVAGQNDYIGTSFNMVTFSKVKSNTAHHHVFLSDHTEALGQQIIHTHFNTRNLNTGGLRTNTLTQHRKLWQKWYMSDTRIKWEINVLSRINNRLQWHQKLKCRSTLPLHGGSKINRQCSAEMLGNMI